LGRMEFLDVSKIGEILVTEKRLDFDGAVG
jgi:hypothetical protein